mmetsp:Transcript_19177/g.60310  ORF Transcript_19177/g.60310 Transcript_19177/m.60310 type:complete len:277 (+) Transcript_19177:22-852(+)
MDEYYARLEVSRTASSDEISKAYRKLSLKYHPDKGGSEMEFKALSEAYEVLKDEKRRVAYDRFGLDLGEDGSADDMAVEIGTHANRAMGVACVRTALTGVVCVGLARRWLRGLGIAGCGIAAIYGRLSDSSTAERVAYRLVVIPVAAWLLSVAGLYWLFESVVAALAFGLAEISGKSKKIATLLAGATARYLLGSRAFLYLKLLLLELAILALGHFFFLLVAAVANQILEHKFQSAGAKVRAILAQSQKDIADLRAKLDKLEKKVPNTPTRRSKHS